MPWPLKKIDIEPRSHEDGGHWFHEYVDKATGERPKPGDCFYYPVERAEPFYPEAVERARAAGRAPIVVMLPGHCWWLVDANATRGGNGWQVTGSIDTDPITLACAPSINFVGTYHGYVQNGVVTEDCEGRRFDADGRTHPQGGP